MFTGGGPGQDQDDGGRDCGIGSKHRGGNGVLFCSEAPGEGLEQDFHLVAGLVVSGHRFPDFPLKDAPEAPAHQKDRAAHGGFRGPQFLRQRSLRRPFLIHSGNGWMASNKGPCRMRTYHFWRASMAAAISRLAHLRSSWLIGWGSGTRGQLAHRFLSKASFG
jgi:hypothetical protein